MLMRSKQVPLEFNTKPKIYKKQHKIKHKSAIFSTKVIPHSGTFISKNVKYLTVKQSSAILKIIKPEMKNISRRTRLTLKPKFDTILTKKPKDIRMGRGKGVPTERVAVIRAGSTLTQLRGMNIFSYNYIYDKCIPKFATKALYIDNKW